MISHMPINSVINSIDDNIDLAESAILSFAKNDLAINAKIGNWLFDDIDNEEDEAIDEFDPAIISIVEAMKRIFKNAKEVVPIEGHNKV